MSTKNTTTQTNTFNQQGLNTYNSLQGQIGSNLNQAMTNPGTFNFQNIQQQQANKSNGASFGSGNSMLLQGASNAGSTGNVSGYNQSQLLSNNRNFNMANSNSYNNLLIGSNQVRYGATQQASAYRPLQTGGTQTGTQSGLGSWAPQVAAALIKSAGQVATAGASG